MRNRIVALCLMSCCLSAPVEARSWEAQVAEASRREAELVGQSLLKNKDTDVLAHLYIWDKDSLRKPALNERPSPQAKVLLLHLWAEWCGPCREEMPVWKELIPQLRQKHGTDLSIVFASESSVPLDFLRFRDDNRTRMPNVPLYSDTGDALYTALRKLAKGGSLPLPITLLLDEHRVIRLAVVGSFPRKRAQLVDLLGKLLPPR
ncbi:MAG TPA: TlpA disulfide reductase family protein [Pseudomonadota bacterium]|nr:TlpA disulfide reductase family protein [Pseudomonadota bacterium]HND11000.1 TlpA disulfide reductase family protein [Pseudomonadota bacterium]HNF98401.1 TlpA disulfide reductase family protein [Pseudomonadota bacterium]